MAKLEFVDVPVPCVTIEGAAEVFGVTPRTVRNWLADTRTVPLFAVQWNGKTYLHLWAVSVWLGIKDREGRELGSLGGSRR